MTGLPNRRALDEHLEEEMGDLLFSLVNYSRFIGINPANALRRTNEKFIKRFQYVETEIAKNDKKIYDATLEEMDKYWEESLTFPVRWLLAKQPALQRCLFDTRNQHKAQDKGAEEYSDIFTDLCDT